MSSFVRANKNLVSRVKSLLERDLRKLVGKRLGDIVDYISFPEDKDLKLYFTEYLYLDAARVIVEEHDSKVVFGISTKDFSIKFDPKSEESLIDNLWFEAYGGYYKDSDIYRSVNAELGVSHIDYSDRRDIVKSSLYSRALGYCSDLISRSEIRLHRDEYPSISNRHILPIMVFSVDDGSGWYNRRDGYRADSNLSFRKGRVGISIFDLDIARHCSGAVQNLKVAFLGRLVYKDSFESRFRTL